MRDPSFFTIRPVIRESSPPCNPPALAERRNGQAVRCYELGPAEVDAEDVISAAVVASLTGTEEVTFELSPEGIGRFNALARNVGLGGRAAIVVDGAVVSAPILQVTEFSGRGVVAGLTADEARHLVVRLER